MSDQAASEAIGNAARLLRNAETITDLALMERLEKLADSWIGIAALCAEHADVSLPT